MKAREILKSRLARTAGAVAALLACALPLAAKANDSCPTSPVDHAFQRWYDDPDVCTTVQKQQPSVTLSTPVQPTFATFRINAAHYTIRNELMKPVTVRLTTSVLDGSGTPLPAQSAPIVATNVVATVGIGVSVTCDAVPPAPLQVNTIDCTITQLNAKGPPPDSATFDIRVQAPPGGAQLKLTANTSWQEPGEDNVTEIEPPRTEVTPLVAPQAGKAASFVPPGGSLATVPDRCAVIQGNGIWQGQNRVLGCPATPSAPWTTTITVGQGANLAEITQGVNEPTCARAGNLLDCRSSVITVPQYESGLVIFLRRDGSTIQGGNIKHGIVYYTGSSPAPSGVVYPLRVPACTDPTYGVLPRKGVPCINYVATPSRPYVTTEYKKKTTPKDGPPTPNQIVPPEFGLDWEFVIYAVDNGRYEQ